jgi:hypothetical protein
MVGYDKGGYMEFDEVKEEYHKILKALSPITGKTIEELDKEISEVIKECENVEEIMIRASEIFDE